MRYSTLERLLDVIRERQSWCPYCAGEKVHASDRCILYGMWFSREIEEEEEKEEEQP